VISVAIAVPAARALARRRFRGRQVMVTLLGAPFILPGIVAVLGILAVWGRSGYVSDILTSLGGSRIDIYGFTGVVLAHVFFNLPLAIRLILQGWVAIPAEHFRLAAQLNMTSHDIHRTLERPMLRSVVPGAFLLVFLLCITSFAVALALGGGPKSTTLEVAIYQALRFDFDLSKAALLAMVQFGLCTAVAAATILVSTPAKFSVGLDRPPQRWDGREWWNRAFDRAILIGIALFLFTPLISVIVKGLPPLFRLPGQVWPAAVNSVSVALGSALLTILIALALSVLILRLSRRRRRMSQTAEAMGFLTLAASPFVIGTGLFILIRPVADPFVLALPVTALVNAAMSLPFALRILLPALARAEDHYGRLADSIGMVGLTRFRLAIWPRIRRPVGFAAGLSAALSMGDLGVIALFAPPDISTLPLTMYRLMAAYQLDAAGGVALLLVSLSLFLFWLFDRGGRLEHHIR
jgi:thiamine transport system permease protein